jgi:hypothetical protein
MMEGEFYRPVCNRFNSTNWSISYRWRIRRWYWYDYDNGDEYSGYDIDVYWLSSLNVTEQEISW